MPHLALLLLAALPAQPLGAALVEHARRVIGVPYDLGGRLRDRDDGLDCQGLVFFAAERVGTCQWRSFSVYPTKSIARGELGAIVPGVGPVATEQLDLSKLAIGDVLWFVGYASNPAEPAIGQLGEREVWVWHLGLYAGDGKFIAGDHHAGEVAELELVPYLLEHASEYAGIIATRLLAPPKPERCRRGARMRPRT